MSDASLSRDYFENLYERDRDPWSFATSAYEREKYTRSLAMLPERIDAALEIGCSIGVFTHALAPRCERLLAIDISERALVAARERCADRPQATFRRFAFPGEAPIGHFDAIVLSEVGYYWSDEDLALARDRIASLLAPGGTLLLVHFLPRVEEYVRDGDAVHAAFLADARFRRTARHRAERYRIDVLRA